MIALGAMKANQILGHVSKSIVSSYRKLIIPLYLALVRPHQECCAHFGASQYKRDMGVLSRTTRLLRVPEHMTYDKKLSVLHFFILEETEE